MSAPAENARPLPVSTTAPLSASSGSPSSVLQLALERARQRVQLLGPLELHDADRRRRGGAR